MVPENLEDPGSNMCFSPSQGEKCLEIHWEQSVKTGISRHHSALGGEPLQNFSENSEHTQTSGSVSAGLHTQLSMVKKSHSVFLELSHRTFLSAWNEKKI